MPGRRFGRGARAFVLCPRYRAFVFVLYTFEFTRCCFAFDSLVLALALFLRLVPVGFEFITSQLDNNKHLFNAMIDKGLVNISSPHLGAVTACDLRVSKVQTSTADFHSRLMFNKTAGIFEVHSCANTQLSPKSSLEETFVQGPSLMCTSPFEAVAHFSVMWQVWRRHINPRRHTWPCHVAVS